MCSICGMVNFINKDILDEKTVEKMGRSMKRRGPDDSDIFHEENVIFHHNRLAVMDPQNGHQPMTILYRGKKYTIVYNGEIYNTSYLKAELKKFGIEPKTNCDTEIVLYCYIAYGEKCPQKLNGIFAFSIFDEERELVFFARDRYGIKPFFYAIKKGTFLFASEIKGLLESPLIKRDVDKEGLWQLLYMAPCRVSGSGIFKDVKEVMPGYSGTFSKDGLKFSEYWSLKAKELKESRTDMILHTRQLLCDAVSSQIESDVPLCTFLSGGLDSSIVTSLTSIYYRKSGRQLDTYSFEYEDNKANFQNSLFQPQSDDEFALYMSEYAGTNHKVLTAPTGLVASCLLNATIARDMPGQADIDSSLWYFCSEVKKNHTVALSGEAADEIFGGYPWFYRPEMLYSDFFPWIHDPYARINLFEDSYVKKDEGFEYVRSIYKNTIEKCPYLDTDSEEDINARRATFLSTRFFMASLLERKDRMSMASGLEVRVPFTDHRILEYVFNVPWCIKFENSTEKALLRNASEDILPGKILHRKKSPYPKTHNPLYEELVTSMLNYRIEKSSIICDLLKKDVLKNFLSSDNVTWFGQLMGKPQLIAWLVQFDYFLDYYKVNLI